MAKLIWGVLCLRVITDQDTNNVSYIDAVEAIGIPGLPHRLPILTLGLLWRREKIDEELTIRFLAKLPGKTEADTNVMHGQVIPKDNLRVNIQFGNSEITQVGDLYLEVEQFVDHEWSKVYELTIPISIFDSEDIHTEAAGTAALPAPEKKKKHRRRKGE